MSNGFDMEFMISQTTCAITKSKACCSSVSATTTSERRTGKHFDGGLRRQDLGYFARRLFVETLECSPDVARVCRLLCTYHHHLALGLVSSPVLADQLLQNVDERLGAACEAAGLSYTRFVDDITITGPFDLEPSGFATLVERVLGEHGFCVNPQKHEYGSLSEGFDVTGIRIRKGRLDAKQEYVAELERQLDDAASLAAGREFIGPFFTRSQILGRVQFVVGQSRPKPAAASAEIQFEESEVIRFDAGGSLWLPLRVRSHCGEHGAVTQSPGQPSL